MKSLKFSTSIIAITAAIFALGPVTPPVYAADLGGKSLKDPVAASEPAQTSKPWEGPYIGLGVGYRWQDWKEAATCLYYGKDKEKWDGTKDDCDGRHDVFSDQVKEDADGFIVSGRIGYDWQRDRVVFGVFGDANWLNANTKHFADAKFSGDLDARLGYLLNQRLLAYIFGGVEFTNFNQGLDTDIAPLAGGGLEYLLGDGWSALAEGHIAFSNLDLPTGIDSKNPIVGQLMIVKKF